jgi:hypothetical protein
VPLADHLGKVEEAVAGVLERFAQVQRNLVLLIEEAAQQLVLNGNNLPKVEANKGYQVPF